MFGPKVSNKAGYLLLKIWSPSLDRKQGPLDDHLVLQWANCTDCKLLQQGLYLNPTKSLSSRPLSLKHRNPPFQPKSKLKERVSRIAILVSIKIKAWRANSSSLIYIDGDSLILVHWCACLSPMQHAPLYAYFLCYIPSNG